MSNKAIKRDRILPSICSPRELMNLSHSELVFLASEIREEIYRLYDHRSVHFASNLGVVELCIALHSTFDFSVDRLIWDTGHQIYPHKLLTGRFEQFQSIRTKGGLMGFPNPAESEYDLLMTGHAGCSVGTALGIASGDDLIDGKNKRHSIAVIGDGAFSSGVVFESMNHAGWIRKNITVILNDNKMSICPRVGGLATYLDKLRMHPSYQRLKQRLHNLVDNMPALGKSMDSVFSRFKSAMKAGLLGGMLFEELGFRYIGPINGHNIARLQRFLKLARNIEDPVLLHVFTEKGHGFKPAVDDPSKYHAPAPGRHSSQNKNNNTSENNNDNSNQSDNDNNNTDNNNDNNNTGNNTNGNYCNDNDHETTGRAKKELQSWVREESDAAPIAALASKHLKMLSFTEHARNSILQIMRENERVCVITAAMCRGNMLEPVREEFPERFFDVGICESHAVIFAAGLAKSGMIPIVDIYSTFIQRSYDQIFQEVSLQNLPIVLMLDRAGLTGPDGPTHHGVFDIGFLRPFPNITIMAPADVQDVDKMIRFAIQLGSPAAIRYPKSECDNSRNSSSPIEIGKSEIIRTGKDGTIVVCGTFLNCANEAADFMSSKHNIETGIINARFIKPLDTKVILEPLRNDRFVITIEEGMLAAGFGSAVLEAANELSIDTRKLKRIGFADKYIEHGERNELLDDTGLNTKNIIKICESVCGIGE
ncbi:MAG: 1-deoxy-D-xylulose-5-phosphate synthase [Planctomycetaceae bacterium]|jgi:1-deoxy-D-xylulose-5-phosphate synthase|nr:1-deoxy-D-xylulose-5-phosphate synthase [Planctomycetaceae bacterium]